MKRLGLLLVALAYVFGCSTPKEVRYDVNYDYNVAYAFGDLKTYVWDDPIGSVKSNPNAVQRIMKAVDDDMAQKGFSVVDEDSDFMIKLFAFSVEKADTSGWAWNPYIEGRLELTVTETQSGQEIWQGGVKVRLDPNSSAEQKDARVNEAVRRILANFPPSE